MLKEEQGLQNKGVQASHNLPSHLGPLAQNLLKTYL